MTLHVRNNTKGRDSDAMRTDDKAPPKNSQMMTPVTCTPRLPYKRIAP